MLAAAQQVRRISQQCARDSARVVVNVLTRLGAVFECQCYRSRCWWLTNDSSVASGFLRCTCREALSPLAAGPPARWPICRRQAVRPRGSAHIFLERCRARVETEADGGRAER